MPPRTLNRADYGIAYGDKYGFKMDVKLNDPGRGRTRQLSRRRRLNPVHGLAGECQRGREARGFDAEEIDHARYAVRAHVIDAKVRGRLAGT